MDIAFLVVAISLVAFAGVSHVQRRIRKRIGDLEGALRRSEADNSLRAYERERSHVANAPPAASLVDTTLLADAIGTGRCVLFSGADLPATTQATAAQVVFDVLIDELIRLDTSVNWVKLREELDPNDLLGAVAARVSQHELVETLQRIEEDRGLTPPESTPRWLLGFASLPFTAIVTTAWDNSLERVLSGRELQKIVTEDDVRAASLMESPTPFVKLLGDVAQPHSILWSLADYYRHSARNPSVLRYVNSLVATNGILFTGFNARTINEVLGFLEVGRTPERRDLFALCRVDDSPRDMSLLVAKYGVSVMTYAKGADLEEFTRKLRANLPQEDRRIRTEEASPHRVQHLHLENIGPFRSLELSLDREWTILLGDNAAGKTTILRALALALSGSDGEPLAAADLLNLGADFGRIDVTVQGVVYSSELVRDRNQVRVMADKVTPVQVGSFLALAFPSLRGVASEEVAGPTRLSGVQGGDPEDLAAMRLGWVDVRLDDVRQWLVNIASRARSRVEEEAREGKRQLELVFELLQRLVPGLRIKYTGLEDAGSWEVLVSVEGETVPVHMLSQGVLATLTWAGTLISRMFETFEPASPEELSFNPAHGEALLLIDELDLHLHPEWQRHIVPAIRATFPNLQVIATTHSPLLVGSMETKEVIHLDRLPNGEVETSLHRTYRGWRADQILTSEAFGLDTTRDERTEEIISEYERLLEVTRPSPDQLRRRTELETHLGADLPRVQETSREREASAMVDELLRQHLSGLPAERRAELVEEANAYLREIGSGE
jgi:energy-coupling factor transporter ATP-binding protein EcfA2